MGLGRKGGDVGGTDRPLQQQLSHALARPRAFASVSDERGWRERTVGDPPTRVSSGDKHCRRDLAQYRISGRRLCWKVAGLLHLDTRVMCSVAHLHCQRCQRIRGNRGTLRYKGESSPTWDTI